MKRLLSMAAALAATMVLAGGAGAQPMRLDGWWVVLTSIPNDGSMAPHRQMETFRATMRTCGVDIFNDDSAKFQGFKPGFLVAVIGAYRTEAEARAQLPKVERCARDAYVRRARHGGE